MNDPSVGVRPVFAAELHALADFKPGDARRKVDVVGDEQSLPVRVGDDEPLVPRRFEIVGENPQETRWGEATVLLRLKARTVPERITVRARLDREGTLVRLRGELSFVPGSAEVDAEGPSRRAIDPNLEKIELQQRDFDNRDK